MKPLNDVFNEALDKINPKKIEPLKVEPITTEPIFELPPLDIPEDILSQGYDPLFLEVFKSVINWASHSQRKPEWNLEDRNDRIKLFEITIIVWKELALKYNKSI
jgi:hypothetical protein